MSEVAVGECVGAVLKPDDDGVDLTYGANQGVVDVGIDGICCNEKAERYVDAMGPGNDVPGCLKGARCLNWVCSGMRV